MKLDNIRLEENFIERKSLLVLNIEAMPKLCVTVSLSFFLCHTLSLSQVLRHVDMCGKPSGSTGVTGAMSAQVTLAREFSANQYSNFAFCPKGKPI